MRIVRDPYINFSGTMLNKLKEEVQEFAKQIVHGEDVELLKVSIRKNLRDFLFPQVIIK